MTELVSLLDQYGIPLVAIVLLSGALGIVFKKLIDALQDRNKRAEVLFDTFQPSIDALTGATEEQTVAINNHTTAVNALLDELRRRQQ